MWDRRIRWNSLPYLVHIQWHSSDGRNIHQQARRVGGRCTFDVGFMEVKLLTSPAYDINIYCRLHSFKPVACTYCSSFAASHITTGKLYISYIPALQSATVIASAPGPSWLVHLPWPVPEWQLAATQIPAPPRSSATCTGGNICNKWVQLSSACHQQSSTCPS